MTRTRGACAFACFRPGPIMRRARRSAGVAALVLGLTAVLFFGLFDGDSCVWQLTNSMCSSPGHSWHPDVPDYVADPGISIGPYAGEFDVLSSLDGGSDHDLAFEDHVLSPLKLSVDGTAQSTPHSASDAPRHADQALAEADVDISFDVGGDSDAAAASTARMRDGTQPHAASEASVVTSDCVPASRRDTGGGAFAPPSHASLKSVLLVTAVAASVQDASAATTGARIFRRALRNTTSTTGNDKETAMDKTLLLSPVPSSTGDYLQKHRIKTMTVTVRRQNAKVALQEIVDLVQLDRLSAVVVSDFQTVCSHLALYCRPMVELLRREGVGAVYTITDVYSDASSQRGERILPVGVATRVNVKAVFATTVSPVPHLLKASAGHWADVSMLSAATFAALQLGPECVPVLQGVAVVDGTADDVIVAEDVTLAASCQAPGGHRSVVIGENVMSLWILRLVLLDSLRYVSRNEIRLQTLRRFQVDIDDVFLGNYGSKPSEANMKDLLNSQRKLSCQIPNFKYNLGFVGGAFRTSPHRSENAGDQFLVDNAHYFDWFPHTHNHTKAHLRTYAELRTSLARNKEFAKKHGISVTSRYAVSPHHSGIYPVHKPLYKAWRDVWNISVSSTEEYMHLKPAFRRRGYQYMGISVLPRQTCGVFSHTLRRSTFPGGPARLHKLANGGELFQTLVDNPISIFMTHYVNFGGEMLAMELIESLVDFVQRYTNLQLSVVPPSRLAQEYFTLNPGEVDPMWQDPCSEMRLYNGWMAPGRECFKLPSVLLTGTDTANSHLLYKLLTSHPRVFGDKDSRGRAVDTSFFGGPRFLRGVDWYMNRFPSVRKQVEPSNNMTSSLYSNPPHIVDMSMSYFHAEKAPLRAWRLLPQAYLIVVVNSVEESFVLPCKDVLPMKMAKSILTRPSIWKSAAEAISRRRCTMSTTVSSMSRWMKFFKLNKIFWVDASVLKSQRSHVLKELHEWLGLSSSARHAPAN